MTPLIPCAPFTVASTNLTITGNGYGDSFFGAVGEISRYAGSPSDIKKRGQKVI